MSGSIGSSLKMYFCNILNIYNSAFKQSLKAQEFCSLINSMLKSMLINGNFPTLLLIGSSRQRYCNENLR